MFSSIFGSMNIKNDSNIIRCFDSGFKILFDPDNLVYTKDSLQMDTCNNTWGYRTLHRVFDDITDYHTATIAHHDLSNEKVVEHFKRGLRRLEHIKLTNIPILFVSTSYYGEFKNNTHNKELIDSIVSSGFRNMYLISIYFDINSPVISCDYNDGQHIIYTVPYSGTGLNTSTYDTTVKDILSKHFTFDNLVSIVDIDREVP